VFLVLAALAAFFQLGWGEQFSSTGFNIAMAGLVFAMALSFLGVWEIPIPGFVGTGRASELESREGAIGAFSKGVITTILSTPCSGPFLGPVFGFTLKQSTPMIFLIFFCVGLGMASPYLLIGAFPKLVKFLPKPGAWMDTIKQIMGFFLLGTVVFLFTFTDKNYLPATFCMLVGIWAACWWIGRTPLYAELRQKLFTWSQAIGVAALVAAFGFYLFVPRETSIAWQPYSRATLEREIAAGNTVLIDFTADWCPTCKANEWLVLNTESVSALVNSNRVVPLVADWTDGSDEIKDVLNQLGSNTIPVYAIFSAERPNEPIVLRDLVTKKQVIAALTEAGPSKGTRVATTVR
ncbi:MAG: thioredoxin family protein, partial [Planctomycetaceae bacterium]|nr:thioredoxin family protein [Planctomycetaceae bacterium]